jgi:hypothetical protein
VTLAVTERRKTMKLKIEGFIQKLQNNQVGEELIESLYHLSVDETIQNLEQVQEVLHRSGNFELKYINNSLLIDNSSTSIEVLTLTAPDEEIEIISLKQLLVDFAQEIFSLLNSVWDKTTDKSLFSFDEQTALVKLGKYL